jgi:hypothetical protein
MPFDDEDYDDEYFAEFLPEYPPRDKKIDEAKEVLLAELFGKDHEKVYYERQVEVLYEDRFFHWITAKALTELVFERAIHSQVLRLTPEVPIRFYWSRLNPRLRYWKRQASKTVKLVRQYSADDFTRLLGHTGEILFDQILPRFGFMPVGFDARSYKEKEWKFTADNLDRIFEKEGIPYGVEIKNTLPYIPGMNSQSKQQSVNIWESALFLLFERPQRVTSMNRIAKADLRLFLNISFILLLTYVSQERSENTSACPLMPRRLSPRAPFNGS